MTTEEQNVPKKPERRGKAAPNPRHTMQYTDAQVQFLDILKKYSTPDPETVTDYVSTQGENVLEEPEKLAFALRDTDVTPVRRKQILKHWFSLKGIKMPDEILIKSGASTGIANPFTDDQRKQANSDEKFAINEETGDIRVAREGEKALSWAQATDLSNKVKARLTEEKKGTAPKYVYDGTLKIVRMAVDGEQGGTLDDATRLKNMAEKDQGGSSDMPFTLDENGRWQPIPGHKFSAAELMAWTAIQRSQAAGQTVDPMEEIMAAGERMRQLRDIFGAGNGIPDWMKDPVSMRQALNPDGGGQSEAVKSLREEIQKLREEQHAGEINRLNATITGQTNQIEALKEQIEGFKTDVDKYRYGPGKTAYDLLADALGHAPDKSDIREMVKTITTNPPRLALPSGGDTARQAATVANKLERVGEVQALENSIFKLG